MTLSPAEAAGKFAVLGVLHNLEAVRSGTVFAVLPLTFEALDALLARFAQFREARAVYPELDQIHEYFTPVSFYGLGLLQPLSTPRFDGRHGRRLHFLTHGDGGCDPPFTEAERSEFRALSDRLDVLEGWDVFDSNPFAGAQPLRADDLWMVLAGDDGRPVVCWASNGLDGYADARTVDVTPAVLHEWRTSLLGSNGRLQEGVKR